MTICEDSNAFSQQLPVALSNTVSSPTLLDWTSTIRKLAVATLLSTICLGCRVHRTEKFPTPNVTLPEAFQSPSSSDARNNEPWWKTFDSPELNDLMGVALEKNLDVKQSWNRLAQASAVYVINRAGQLPALRINSGASITQTTDRKPLSASQQFIDIAESLGVPVIDGDLTTENIIVGGGLSYELDIWRRVNSLKASARSNLSATF
ncbi:MAG TPA: hypothetical protein DDW77_04600, partial [Verrucomicrobiales bacterium]|nr:hypothetical protein [Verrucomicrobiales bacterium]